MKNHFLKAILVFILCLCSFRGWAQFEGMQLSPDARISLITCSSGSDLYAIFGHSAVRVQDPATGMDVIFNYGTFDFNEPGFYLKFIRGKLNYKLSAAHFQDFLYSYSRDNRSVYEQVLNFTPEQKLQYWNFLTNNYLPENRFYLYDFFFDNCATRIRDGVEASFPNQVTFNIAKFDKDYSFRNLIDLYLVPQPWSDFGIDLALGVPIDREASPYEYMFLPDYLSEGFANATLSQNGKVTPLVAPRTTLFEQEPVAASNGFFTPVVACWLLFVVILAFTISDIKNKTRSRKLDVILFATVGLLGVVLFLLWFATDHQAAANNLNLLWALPTHLVAAFLLGRTSLPAWFIKYLHLTAILVLILFVFFVAGPQNLHPAIFPIALSLMMRAEYTSWISKKTSKEKAPLHTQTTL
ncbi:Lnb N-terminal periplasmic domain-containing protein [Pontibacter arcticus]|uniref:Uncharacterized protein n=1 Tax=Pontibacter arcticus TaxID=2080288 RepID=A0A364RJ84_9BACT|nr:DUF4105 domain-containing protein [Pontibacter arcticus]RAU84286.1 hypothetical protein DP923_04390 [Pontibacter arcticus]